MPFFVSIRKKRPLIFAYTAFVFLASILAMGTFAHADIYQSDDGGGVNFYNTFGTSVYASQQLGTGISGTVTSIGAYVGMVHTGGGGAGVASYSIECFTDESYTSSCGRSATGTVSVAGGFTGWATTTISTYTLSSGNAYMLHVNVAPNNGGDFTYIFGTPDDAYPNGDAVPPAIPPAAVNGLITDLAFATLGTAGPPVVDTTTRIQTVIPTGGSTIATSTAATLGATGYINPSDFSTGMYIEIKYASYTSMQTASGASPSFFFTTLNLPLSSAGAFSVSTTSPVLIAGQYTMNTSIRTPSFTNTALNFLGFGQFATFGIRSATTSNFTAAHLNGYDIYVASTTALLNDYLASSTVSLAACSSWTSFNLGDCLNLMFVPQSQPILQALGSFKDGFLSYFPWGYVTRFTTLLTSSATTSLPTFTADVQIGPTATTSLTFDMQDTLAGGGALLDSIPATNGAGNIRDLVEPWLKLFIGISVLFIIVTDLMGMSHTYNARHNGRE